MTPEHFDALFDTFHVTAVRLETLPAYDVAGYEGDRLQAFRDGRALPERSILTDPWLARIARTSMAGKVWERVRIIDQPLTEYQRFELAVYGETQAVGERILVAHREDVSDDGPDVWLFDLGTPGARAVLMRYGDDGAWLGADLTEDPAVLEALATRLRQVRERAVALNKFLAVAYG